MGKGMLLKGEIPVIKEVTQRLDEAAEMEQEVRFGRTGSQEMIQVGGRKNQMAEGKIQNQQGVTQGRQGMIRGQAEAEMRVGVDREAGGRRGGKTKGVAGGDQEAERGREVKTENLLLTAKLLRAGASSSRLRRLLWTRCSIQSDSCFFNNFQVATRREIFDKRPEDHPAYGEEWRIFWEKRWELSSYGIGLARCIS